MALVQCPECGKFLDDNPEIYDDNTVVCPFCACVVYAPIRHEPKKPSPMRVVVTAALVLVIIYNLFVVRTVASGNGWKHQVVIWGDCNLYTCDNPASHRIHSGSYDNYYCDDHWEEVGQDLFIGLTDGKDDTIGIKIVVGLLVLATVFFCISNLILFTQEQKNCKGYTGNVGKTQKKVTLSFVVLFAAVLFVFCTITIGEKESEDSNKWDKQSLEYNNQNSEKECALSHCSSGAQEGSPYCITHGCCEEGCKNEKDPLAHCCDRHNCKEPGCAAHRYEYADSEYCHIHHNRQSDD